jgi:hypothetical protein
MKQRGFFYRHHTGIISWSLLIGGFAIASCSIQDPDNGSGGIWTAWTYVGLGIFLGVIAIWFIYIFVKLFIAFDREAKVAFTPVPSPQEIALRLHQEWGRPATIEEVAAVHQILTSQKNQALLATGLTLGALYSANRLAHGEKIL